MFGIPGCRGLVMYRLIDPEADFASCTINVSRPAEHRGPCAIHATLIIHSLHLQTNLLCMYITTSAALSALFIPKENEALKYSETADRT